MFARQTLAGQIRPITSNTTSMIRMRRHHPTVTEAVAVTAEATTEAAKQKDDEDNDE